MNVLFWVSIGIVIGWASCIGFLAVIAWLIQKARKELA